MAPHAVVHRSWPVRSSIASATRSSPGLPHMSSSVSWSRSTTTSSASLSASASLGDSSHATSAIPLSPIHMLRAGPPNSGRRR